MKCSKNRNGMSLTTGFELEPSLESDGTQSTNRNRIWNIACRSRMDFEFPVAHALESDNGLTVQDVFPVETKEQFFGHELFDFVHRTVGKERAVLQRLDISESVIRIKPEDVVKRKLQILLALFDIKSGRLEFFVLLPLRFGKLPLVVKMLSDVNPVHDQKPDEYDKKVEGVEIVRRGFAFQNPAADFGERNDDGHSHHRRKDKLYDNPFERMIFVRHFFVEINHDAAQSPPRAPALYGIERVSDQKMRIEADPVVGQVIIESADKRNEYYEKGNVVVFGCRHFLPFKCRINVIIFLNAKPYRPKKIPE
jgi:hypothetical protein